PRHRARQQARPHCLERPGSWPNLRGQQDSARVISQHDSTRTKVLPAEVCERMRNEMEDRSSRRMRTLVTQMAPWGLSGNEIASALISMMARSTQRFNQRPDTLMHDRTSANSTNSLAPHGRTIHWGHSCNGGMIPRFHRRALLYRSGPLLSVLQ